MRYEVDGLHVDSEMAALSSTRGSAWLLVWIGGLDPEYEALDYGCGRLRYTVRLAETCKSVMAVDSSRQFSRRMIIHGEKASIPEYVERHLSNVQCETVEAFTVKNRYDIAICVNVLSAIPEEGARRQVLKNVFHALVLGGVALFVNQYRNSYFKSYQLRDDVTRHHDGWLIPNGGRASFYGLIRPAELCELCLSAGYHIVKFGSKGESGYVLAGRPGRREESGENVFRELSRL